MLWPEMEFVLSDVFAFALTTLLAKRGLKAWGFLARVAFMASLRMVSN